MATVVMIILFHLVFGAMVEAVNVANNQEVISSTEYVMSSNNKERIVGKIRYHYYKDDTTDENHGHCTSILALGVGTAMSIDDYDYASHQIVLTNPTVIVIVTDSNYDDIVKTSPSKYANLLDNIYEQLHFLIPVCDYDYTGVSSPIDLFIGGHSSSGQAALEALQGKLFHFIPAGFIGLDPFKISSDTVDYNAPLYLPSLHWGFTKTTCMVDVNEAALGAYHLFAPISDSKNKTLGRVLYLIDNEMDSRELGHCVFTDKGCGVESIVVCPTIHPINDNWVYDALAHSIQLFLKAVEKGVAFTKDDFHLNKTFADKVFTYVNDEMVKDDKRENTMKVTR